MKTINGFLKTHRCAALALAVIAALLAVTGVLAASAGSLDPTFDGDGKVVTDIGGNDWINDIAIQSDGNIIVAGYSNNLGEDNFALARYNSDGSLDTTFDYDGKVVTDIRDSDYGYAIAIQLDGKIVVAGYSITGSNYDFSLARYNSNGSLDSTFDYDGKVVTDIGASDWAQSVAIQSDGRIVVAGTSNNLGEYNFALARYNSNGSLDTTFDYDGKVVTDIRDSDYVYAIALQSDGKIVAAGYSITGSGNDFSLARYNSNGSLDSTFDYDGKVVTDIRGEDNDAYAVALQADGKIVAAGMTGYKDFALVRYNSNGSPDSTFDNDGIVVTDFDANDIGKAVAIQSDGRIVMVGYSDRWGTYDFALTRYNTNGSIDTDFDKDGRVLTSINNSDGSYAVTLQSDGKIVAAGGSDGNFALTRYYWRTSDSATVKSNGGQDGFVLESAENSNAGSTMNATATTFKVGDNAQDKQFRSILSFDTSSLPDNAVLTKIRLMVKQQGMVGTNPFTTHGNLTVDVIQGSFGGNPALQLTDFQATAGKNGAGVLPNSPVNGWYTKVWTKTIAPYINKTGMTQFRLRFQIDDNDDLSDDYVSFYSGNHTSASVWPKLIIEYYVP